jgi:hypothetical protein
MLAPSPGASGTVASDRDRRPAPSVRATPTPSLGSVGATTPYADDLRWERTAAEVVELAARVGRLPSTVADAGPVERRHARWLRHQRELSRTGSLRRWRSEWLDRNLAGWRRPSDARWRATAVRVALHRIEHGHLPTMTAGDDDVRRLGNWLHDQRRRHRSGRLEADRAMWLDLNLPGWDDPAADTWYANAEACAAHLADEGRFPSGGAESETERRLAVWLRSQRVIARRGRLADERRGWLDEALPGWDRPHESDWFALASALVVFEQSTGRMPRARADADGDERRLSAWLARQRSRHAAGRLPERCVVWLDDRLPRWRTRVTDQWSCRLEATISFAAVNGRLPARSSDVGDEERGLAIWLGNQRAASRSGRLSAERERQLGAALPGWASVRGTSWSANADALARFAAAHGRLPALTEADAEARRLAIWLGRQRTAANAGALDPERERTLRLRVPGWRTHHLSAWLSTAERVARFHGESGHLPTRRNDASPLERELGVWLNNQRSAARSGRLEREREHWLDQQLPGWDEPRLAAWIARAVAVADFRHAAGHLPSSSASDDSARRLGTWLDAQRSAFRKGSLDARRTEWLDGRLPGWEAAETVGLTPPRPSPADEVAARSDTERPVGEARILDEWLERLASRGRDRLHGEQLDWLDANLPGWDQRSA